jgi:dihydrofolate reductase
MIISAIFAADFNNAIGKNNQLLWHLPADLKFFKNTTIGCPVIMGRKTYESMGRLLPGRKNIIISKNPDYQITGAEIYQSLETAIKACSDDRSAADQKIFIIGGAKIFELAFEFADEIYRTVVKSSFDADVFVPEINKETYTLAWEECHAADEKNKFDYCFQKWLRK